MLDRRSPNGCSVAVIVNIGAAFSTGRMNREREAIEIVLAAKCILHRPVNNYTQGQDLSIAKARTQRRSHLTGRSKMVLSMIYSCRHLRKKWAENNRNDRYYTTNDCENLEKAKALR